MIHTNDYIERYFYSDRVGFEPTSDAIGAYVIDHYALEQNVCQNGEHLNVSVRGVMVYHVIRNTIGRK